MSIKAMTSNANVLSAAHISVRPMYIHKNSHFGAKYPPPLFVPVESRIILCNVCDPAYAFPVPPIMKNMSYYANILRSR